MASSGSQAAGPPAEIDGGGSINDMRSEIQQRTRACFSPDLPSGQQTGPALVSFCGSTGSGKSEIVRRLLRQEGAAEPKVFKVTDGGEGATSGSFTMQPWGQGWLLDSSKAHVALGAEASARQHCIPRLALLASNVFCYVVKEGPGNLSAYTEVQDLATNTRSQADSTLRPSLVVIQNNVGYRELKTFDKSSEIFRGIGEQDAHRPLSKLFSSVWFVQLPVCDEEIYVAKLEKSQADLFKERIQELSGLLQRLVAEQQKKQSCLDVVLTQGRLLKLVECIGRTEAGSPVNISVALTDSKLPDESFFKDVWIAFEVMVMPRAIQNSYNDLDGLIDVVLKALDSAVWHAAVLMVGQEAGSTDPQAFLKYSKALEFCMEKLAGLIPCCAEHEARAGPQSVCGQLKRNHQKHVSLIQEEDPAPWWNICGARHSIEWEGGHCVDDAILQRLREMGSSVFRDARQISAELSAPGTGQAARSVVGPVLREWRRDKLPYSVKRHFRNTLSHDLGSCYVCSCQLAPSPWWCSCSFLWSQPGIDVCNHCAEKYMPPLSIMGILRDLCDLFFGRCCFGRARRSVTAQPLRGPDAGR